MGLLDEDRFCSLFVAVDDFYLNKLLLTYPTWVHTRPEIVRMPHVFVADAEQVTALDPRWGQIHKAREAAAVRHGLSLRDTRFEVVPWSMDHNAGISQREEMLTGLVRSAHGLSTPWYLKLDADTFSKGPGGFYYDKWFREEPCYISNPWNYTKPAGTVALMNTWATGVPELAALPEVPFKTAEGPKAKDVHSRMASWIMFGSSAWTAWASDLCKESRLPFPSQDTYLSYVQARTGKNWVPAKFRGMNWEHCRNVDGLKNACLATMLSLRIP
jgi:hypothetical protein